MACVWIEGFENHKSAAQLGRKYASFSGSYQDYAGRVLGNAAGMGFVATTPVIASGNTAVIGWGCLVTADSASLLVANGLYFEDGVDEQFHITVDSEPGVGTTFELCVPYRADV